MLRGLGFWAAAAVEEEEADEEVAAAVAMEGGGGSEAKPRKAEESNGERGKWKFFRGGIQESNQESWVGGFRLGPWVVGLFWSKATAC